MHQLQRFRIFLVQIDTRNTGIMHLLEKLLHVRAPLVPHPCIGKQTATAPGLEYPDAEIDVLAKTHFGEASQPAVDFRPDSHVEGARIELIHFLLSSPDASRSEKRGHGIADGLLHVRERFMCPVGTAERIGRLAPQLVVYGLQISRWKHAVRIQHYQVLAAAAFCPVITGLARPGVRLVIILHRQASGVFLYHVAARTGRTVLHHDRFKVRKRLPGKAFQQFIHLIGTIVNRYNQRIFHCFNSRYERRALIGHPIFQTPQAGCALALSSKCNKKK